VLDHSAFPFVVSGFVTALATAYGLLPERLDATHVFAAYGVGALVVETVAARHPWVDAAIMTRRWGSGVMLVVAGYWLVGLLSSIL
jgi:hypothetical protein